MDFVVGFPMTLGKYDLIWVIMDRFTKSAQFTLARVDFISKQLARINVKEIVRLHGCPF